MFKNFIKKNRIIHIFFMIFFLLISCKKIENENIYKETLNNKLNISNNILSDNLFDDFEINDYHLFEDHSIFLLKNQSEGQILSVIIKNNLNDDLVVFDGGRIEDSTYLSQFIKQNGGIVKYWFITHMHDDHLGALYSICKNNKNDIKIDNICYDFPDLEWSYKIAGDEIGSSLLFEQAVNEYLEYNKNNFKVNIIDDYSKNKTFDINGLIVRALNEPYEIEHDPINNSSIVYKINIEDKSLLVLGDLSYYGGKELLNNIDKNVLKSDIVVMAHHGQNGVDEDVYRIISPSFALWPTTKKIYENVNNKYKTDETKKIMKDLNAISITTIEKSQILK